MAFWSTEKLRERIPQDNLISDYKSERVKHSAYELALGSAALVTGEGKPQHNSLSTGNGPLEIPPGQFGLLLTEEVVRVPPDAMAFISIRASIKFQGLINVSGFHVDPGYNDRLKFSIYNAGGRSIYISPGERIFMIWYADLDRRTDDTYKGEAGKNSALSSVDYNRMEGEVSSPGQLKIELAELRALVEARAHTTETWAKVIIALISSLLLYGLKDIFSKPSGSGQPTVVINQGAIPKADVPQNSNTASSEPSSPASLPIAPSLSTNTGAVPLPTLKSSATNQISRMSTNQSLNPKP